RGRGTPQALQELDHIDATLAATPQQRTLQHRLLLTTQPRNALWLATMRSRKRRGSAAEGMATGEQFVSDASEAVDIIARMRIAAVHSLHARIGGRGDRAVVEPRSRM